MSENHISQVSENHIITREWREYIVDHIIVKQDVGDFEPVYKRIRLDLWSNGAVTWSAVPTTTQED